MPSTVLRKYYLKRIIQNLHRPVCSTLFHVLECHMPLFRKTLAVIFILLVTSPCHSQQVQNTTVFSNDFEDGDVLAELGSMTLVAESAIASVVPVAPAPDAADETLGNNVLLLDQNMVDLDLTLNLTDTLSLTGGNTVCIDFDFAARQTNEISTIFIDPIDSNGNIVTRFILRGSNTLGNDTLRPCPDGACVIADSFNNGLTNEPAALLRDHVSDFFAVDLSQAISGASLRQVPLRVANKGSLPQLGVLALGLNDVAGGSSSTVAQLLAHFDTAISEMTSAGAETIIVATIPPFGSTQNAGFTAGRQQLILDANAVIRERVANNPNLLLWEVYTTLDQDGDNFTDPQFLNTPDDIHPGNAGSAAMAQVLINLVDTNFSFDRQRLGYSTMADGDLKLDTPPLSFWWGLDTTPISFDAANDAHISLTIRGSSFDVSTTSQSGLDFSANELANFDGTSIEIAEVKISSIGALHGGYFDNIQIAGRPADQTTLLLGDIDFNGVVNFLDISPFIGVLVSGVDQAEADIDQNGIVNFLDIAPFISILSGSGS